MGRVGGELGQGVLFGGHCSSSVRDNRSLNEGNLRSWVQGSRGRFERHTGVQLMELEEEVRLCPRL